MPHYRQSFDNLQANVLHVVRKDDLDDYKQLSLHIIADGLSSTDGKYEVYCANKTTQSEFRLKQTDGTPFDIPVENGDNSAVFGIFPYDHLVLKWNPGTNVSGTIKIHLLAKN